MSEGTVTTDIERAGTDASRRLEARFRRIARLDHASTFLDWDRMVVMPSGGAAPRAAALAELAALSHELLADPLVGEWLDEAEGLAEGVVETSVDRSGAASDAARGVRPHEVRVANLREMRRAWRDAAALPPELVRAQVTAGAHCEQGWREQRAANDWRGFLVNFRPVVALAREEAEARRAAAPGRFATPYDALLERHCAGDDQALVNRAFDTLRNRLPTLFAEAFERQRSRGDAGSRSLPPGRYPLPAQQSLSERVMRRFGFDFGAGRLDTSLHPFSTGVRGDLRITTRYRESDFLDALQATIHETGHASYEAGLPAEFDGLPLGRARNMSIHESQSLLFERHIGLSRRFLGACVGDVHELLPDARGIDAERLWRAATRVAPSYIRVEADELGYPLHVMLRHAIESALINGDMEAADVPDAWEEGMLAAFGLSVGDEHSKGCLQDIHWTEGAFGYFPSYTLGAINAAQLWAALRGAHPDWAERLAAGDTAFARDWLAARIWSRGSLLESQPLMAAASGSGTDAAHLVRHLERRYLDEED